MALPRSKTTTARTFYRLLLGSFALAVGVACGPHPRSVTNNDSLVPELLYVDGDAHLIDQLTSADTVIYKRLGVELTPLLEPNGAPITWGLFNGATGSATVTCSDAGTEVSLEMHGLIPNGIYSQWVGQVAPPGIRELGGLALIGASPLGPLDGSEADVFADANGEGSLTRHIESGPTNFSANGYTGSFPDCLLDTYSFAVISFYSNKQAPLGESLGDPHGYAMQQDWFFDNGRATAP